MSAADLHVVAHPSGLALTTTSITKAYGEHIALEPLDLTVAARTRVALVGHNGSGKTTMMKLAAGVLDATAGTIEVFGHTAGSTDARRLLSWLGDTPTFYDDISLWEHMEYVARLHGVEEWEPRAARLVDLVGLGERRDQIPTTFSRGMRQKAAIALAFVRPFALLLVDEPFVGLDNAGRVALLALLDEVAAAGATTIVATHELGFVDRVDRVLALRDGALVHDGDPHAIDIAVLVDP